MRKEVFVPVWCKRSLISSQRVDLIVDEKVIVEIKSTEILRRDAPNQLRNYLQATAFEVGMPCTLVRSHDSTESFHTNKPFAVTR